jgi:phosphate transport system protein
MKAQSRPLLDRELFDLNAHILSLTSMVDSALERAMKALIGRDEELARQVIADDEAVNTLRFEIEVACLTLLATQQPFAIDLRTVITVQHLATELERIGDHAAGIARLVERLAGEDEIASLHKLPKMAKRARRMLQKAIQAFVDRDAEMAEKMVRHDDKLNKHYRSLFVEALEEMRDDDYIRRATYLLWVGHDLERIGDRATNIAERVIFLATGRFVENLP